MSEIEFRQAQVIDVSFPKRLIELVVMPYETETLIAHRGKTFTEICSRGAYEGIEARNDRVRVNRDHDVTRTVGRAVRFHPSRDEGLVADIRISETDLGNETLVLADDGVLDASAGFGLLRDKRGRVVPGAEVWENSSRRRLNRLFLGHIGLTPDPAYETANVLAVRGHEPAEAPVAAKPKPNMSRYELMLARDEEAALSARYTR